jgi:hypothetical protein
MVNYGDYSRYFFVYTTNSVAMAYVQPILEELFSVFGTPQVYKTNNEAPFMSHRLAVCRAVGFKHRKEHRMAASEWRSGECHVEVW